MSITRRVWLGFTVVCAVLVVLCAVETASLLETRRQARVAETVGAAMQDLRGIYLSLREAESHQRGFLLTGDHERARLFDLAVRDFYRSLDTYRAVVTDGRPDNPLSAQRAADMGSLEEIDDIGERAIGIMRGVVHDWNPDDPDFAGAAENVREVRNGTERVQTLVEAMIARDAAMLETIGIRRAEWQRRTFVGLVGGGLVIIVLLALLNGALVRHVRRSFAPLLEGTRRLGAGDFSFRIARAGTDEVGRLSRAFDDMAHHLEAAVHHRDAAERARHAAIQELETQSAAMETIGRLSNRLQACESPLEFGAVMAGYVPRILPGAGGGLYLLAEGTDDLRLEAAWGKSEGLAKDFSFRDCWATRRGQIHRVADGAGDVPCSHATAGGSYRCVPLIGHGDTIGVLHLSEVSLPGVPADAGVAAVRRLEILVETLALALANVRLRQSLHERSIRDPLTGLLNRRYLDEAIEVELARARRSGAPFSAIMLDVDHFKRFNDDYGHAAGDLVLSETGVALRAAARSGDIVCRFGGEEFCVILPGATAAQAMQRAEALRRAIGGLRLSHQGTVLPTLTISAGVAQWPVHGNTAAELLRQADGALYQAKHAGRNRVAQAADPADPSIADVTISSRDALLNYHEFNIASR